VQFGQHVFPLTLPCKVVQANFEPGPTDTPLRQHFPRLNIERPSYFTTSSQKTTDQILRWMMTCKVRHTSCGKPVQLSTLPTRLLDLDQSATVDLVKLVESKALRGVVKYITLSHSWGKILPCKLTRECFEVYKSGIMSSSLPLTFQHAIDLTRRLDYRYLWIDAYA
jgi:hypothetical protein